MTRWYVIVYATDAQSFATYDTYGPYDTRGVAQAKAATVMHRNRYMTAKVYQG